MMRRNFVKTELLNLDIFEKHFSSLLRCMPHDGSTIELRDLLQKLTMDISSDFLLGHSTNSLGLHATQSKDEFSQAWSKALSWIPLRAHLGSLMDWIPHPSFFRACKTIHAYADELVVMAIAAKPQPKHKSRYIFLHALAEEIADPVQLRDHTLSILCAGRDTTAEVLSCAVNILSKHPDNLSLLRQETSRLNGQKPSLEDLKGMKYLRNVIFEG
jgi:cytochrome P450